MKKSVNERCSILRKKSKSTQDSNVIKHDKKGNEVSCSKATAKRPRIKKIITNNVTSKHIKEISHKPGKPKTKLKHVIQLTDWLYITCDSHTWKLMEINDTVNPATGSSYPDKGLLYCPYLDDMLKSCAHHMLKIPDDVKKLNDNFKHVYSLIDARIPADIKPKDLFKVKEMTDNE